MTISIKEVAALAGVSTGTVSNVFNGKASVDRKLAGRVREAARVLGYEPNRAAAQLRGRPARVVAALVPDLNNPFFTNLLASLEACVRERGFDLIVASSNGSPREERERLGALLAWQPAGLIVVPCDDEFESRALPTRRRVPFVVVDRVPGNFRGDAVSVDNADAGRLAAEHLTGLGHGEILVAASTLGLQNIRERCDGIAQVFGGLGLPAPPVIEVGLSFEQATERIGTFLAGGGHPTAFLALTTFATLGILTALREWNRSIPGDVSVVGFDDYSWMQAVSPPLTSIRQPVEAIGREAWERLRARIEGSGQPPSRIRLQCDLMERASTAPPNGPRRMPADAGGTAGESAG